MKCTPENGGWGNGAGQVNYTIYFYCLFSRPLVDFGIWSADIPEGISRKNESNDDENYYQYVRNAVIHPQAKVMQGKHLGFYTQFPTRKINRFRRNAVYLLSVWKAHKRIWNMIYRIGISTKFLCARGRCGMMHYLR